MASSLSAQSSPEVLPQGQDRRADRIRLLVAGVAAVSGESRAAARSPLHRREIRNRTVHSTAAKLHSMTRPRCGKHNPEIDRASMRTGIGRRHRPVDGAICRRVARLCDPARGRKRNSGDRLTD